MHAREHAFGCCRCAVDVGCVDLTWVQELLESPSTGHLESPWFIVGLSSGGVRQRVPGSMSF